jgi:hypothetical protein
MDRIVTIKRVKKYDCLSRENEIRQIRDHISSHRAFCVYGKCGVGKTHLIRHCLETETFVEVDSDSLKNKLNMLEFFDRFSGNKSIVLYDNFDFDLAVCKDFVEFLLSPHNPFTRSVIMCTTSDKCLDLCDSVYVPPLPYETLISLAKTYNPRVDPHECVSKSQGNIHDIEFYISCGVFKDQFSTPKDYMYRILSNKTPINKMDREIQEHGYLCGLVHDNYVDVKGLSLDEMYKISESLSFSDVIDQAMYSDDWNFLDYFVHQSIIYPSHIIRGRFKKHELRPGSVWTKFNNYKTRKNKLSVIKVSMEYFKLLIHYGVKFLKSYKIKPNDLDVINHTFLYDKLKPKQITILKKQLADSYLGTV